MLNQIMSTIQSTGICLFCNENFSKRSIKTHLLKCKSKAENNLTDKTLIIFVEGKYAKDFWLYIEIDQDSNLEKIDKMLRDVWLECCGHLSKFYINYNDVSMKTKINSFIEQKPKIEYDYDFGSTTELTLKIISESSGNLGKKKIRIDAINNLPDIKCAYCENKADLLCPYCYEEEMCNKHANNHSCVKEEGEDILLPLVNSPRMGECGYEGAEEKTVKSYFPVLSIN